MRATWLGKSLRTSRLLRLASVTGPPPELPAGPPAPPASSTRLRAPQPNPTARAAASTPPPLPNSLTMPAIIRFAPDAIPWPRLQHPEPDRADRRHGDR